MNVLVLDKSYQPHRIISWQRAITMWFQDKVEVLEEYDEDIRSVSICIKMPAVVRLLSWVRKKKKMAVKFSRTNVALRDRYTCQYCGNTFPLSKLTYDHVIPRSHGGKTCWDNIVMACSGPRGCNSLKANRTPKQAGMPLLNIPKKPAFLPVSAIRIEVGDVPRRWAVWLY